MEFQIGSYNDKVLCDIIPMDVCHILLGRPWKYDRKAMQDGRRKTYTLEKNCQRQTLLPFQAEGVKEKDGPSVLIISGKKLLE